MGSRTHTIASRASKLALWQANHVKDLMLNLGAETDILEVQTTGDKVQDRFLHEIGGKGLFIKEVEAALLEGKADLAVHSLKDLPVDIEENFRLCAILKRNSPYDSIIFKKSSAARVNLKSELIVGKEDIMLMGRMKVATGSLRRSSLLKEASNTLEVIGLRGNVDTRLNKLDTTPEWDAIILAEASLERLGLGEGFEVRRLDPKWFVPSASQGALVIETKKDCVLNDVISKLDCYETRLAVELERLLLKRLGGDCTLPFGCHFSWEPRDGGSDVLVGRSVILATDGTCARSEISLPKEYPLSKEDIVNHMMKKLFDDGAPAILDKLNLTQPRW